VMWWWKTWRCPLLTPMFVLFRTGSWVARGGMRKCSGIPQWFAGIRAHWRAATECAG